MPTAQATEHTASHLQTLLAHAGTEPDPVTGAITSPIHLSTTFLRGADGEPLGDFTYARQSNPNRALLEATLAKLEGGAVAAAFGSGVAAALAVFMALQPGDHVLAPLDVYNGVRLQLTEIMMPWGLRVSFVNMGDLNEVRQALTPATRLIWAETPSNPRLQITDLVAIAEIAQKHSEVTGNPCLAVADNTFATPLFQQPLALGFDLVMHATTKYLGGHSDLLGGAIIAKREDDFFARVRQNQTAGGGIPSPFDCWLLLRGLRSLAARMPLHADNAQTVAEFLAQHPAVSVVHYPGLPAHPGHEIAARQMRRFGGIVAFELVGGREKALAVARKTRLFLQATSLGGTESLIEHRASAEGQGSTAPPALLRLSVGLEHPADLVADLAQALS